MKKRDPEYVDGAEVGMLFNTLTREIYDGEKGVQAIPCSYVRQYIEWEDRGKDRVLPKTYTRLILIYFLKQLVMSNVKIDLPMVIISKILLIILYSF